MHSGLILPLQFVVLEHEHIVVLHEEPGPVEMEPVVPQHPF